MSSEELPTLDALHHELTCSISLLRMIEDSLYNFASERTIGIPACALEAAIGSFERVREQLEALSYQKGKGKADK
jgi:hypothetical protein